MTVYLVPMLTKLFYLDPGAGSMLLQMALAALLGLAVVIRLQWSKIKGLFVKKTKNPDEEEEDKDE